MGFSLELNKLPYRNIISTTLIIFCSIFPPLWFTYFHYPELFIRLAWWQLLLVSISIGFPILAFCTISTANMLFKNTALDKSFFPSLFYGATIYLTGIYSSVVLRWWNIDISAETYTTVFIIAYLFYIVLSRRSKMKKDELSQTIA